MFQNISLVYPAKITPDNGGFVVTFRDLNNVFTEGDTYEEALYNAQKILDLLLLDMAKDGLNISDATSARKDEVFIAVSPDVAVPVLLYKIRTM